ncbi:MAG: hypothetical protein LBO79_07600 [Zoogloeaceae bacterium]|jgi:hypothetical protein|nr:hypothetical protein [Zoogloeaceae bacterium]
MKAGFKRGLILLAGLIFSVAAMANEPIPIEDKDVFEKQLITCITSELENDCIASLFSVHLGPTAKDRDNLINYANSAFKKRVGKIPAHKIHVVSRMTKADLIDERTYIIECSNSDFYGLHINFKCLKGKWYLFRFSFGSSAEFIRRILDFPSTSGNAGK